MFIRRLLVVSMVLCVIFHASPSAAYKILMLPIPLKSHVFPILAIGDGLTARGHEVTVLLGENFAVDVTKIDVGQRVERYEDNGTDSEAMYGQLTTMTMSQDEGASMYQVLQFASQE